MISGTTPTFTLYFNGDVQLYNAIKIQVTLSDAKNGEVLVTKNKDQMEVYSDRLKVTYTQDETLLLAGKTTILRANWVYAGNPVPKKKKKKKYIYWERNEVDMVIDNDGAMPK